MLELEKARNSWVSEQCGQEVDYRDDVEFIDNFGNTIAFVVIREDDEEYLFVNSNSTYIPIPSKFSLV